MKKIRLLLALVAIMVIGSCTVEKRRYTDGYHVEWHKNKGKGVQAETKEMETTADVKLPESATGDHLTNDVTSPENMVLPNLPENEVASNKENNKSPKISKVEKNRLEEKHQGIVSKKDLFNNFNRASVQTFTSQPMEDSSETDTVLLVILAILLPPLAVYLYEGSWTSRCTVNLILTLLCGIPGVIHALVIILGNK